MNTAVDPAMPLIQRFIDDLPFNQLVGLQLFLDDSGSYAVRFSNDDNLTGNPLFKTLHGGMIATAMDVAGALPVLKTLVDRQIAQGKNIADLGLKTLARAFTIDLKVDYLRPGKGKHFICRGTLRHLAIQIAFTDMELYNERDVLIARATGTYLLGS